MKKYNLNISINKETENIEIFENNNKILALKKNNSIVKYGDIGRLFMVQDLLGEISRRYKNDVTPLLLDYIDIVIKINNLETLKICNINILAILDISIIDDDDDEKITFQFIKIFNYFYEKNQYETIGEDIDYTITLFLEYYQKKVNEIGQSGVINISVDDIIKGLQNE